jgi:hypothetical protein
LNRPDVWAARAFWCDRRPKASWIGAGNLEALGHVLGGEAHGNVGIGHLSKQLGTGGKLMAAHGDDAHGFDAARHNDVGLAPGDRLGGHGNGLQP